MLARWRKFMVGQGKARAGFVGQIGIDITTNGKSKAAGAQTLASFNIPANTLYKNGQGLRIQAMLVTAANGNAKPFTIQLGGITISAAFSPTDSGAEIWVEVQIIRTGSKTQIWFSEGTSGSTLLAIAEGTTAIDDTVDNTCAIAAGAATADNDLTAQCLMAEALTV